MDLTVFGASGFIGQAIVNEAANRGLNVAGISRHGRPSYVQPRPNVRWISADALEPDTYRGYLKDTKAVVVSIGAPPLPFADEAQQIKMNGQSNAEVVQAANEAGVRRVVLVNALMPQWCPAGYMRGKLLAEQAAKDFVEKKQGNGAVVLKPSTVYGTRHTQGGWPVPLWLAMAPASQILRVMPTKWLRDTFPYLLEGALAPPVPVQNVAKAAVDAATQPGYDGKFTVIDNETMVGM